MELWELIGFAVAILAMGASCATFFGGGSNTSAVPQAKAPEATAVSKNLSADPATQDRACFGAGCYWGTEKYLRHDFAKRNKNGSIRSGSVGFMGPSSAPANPSYDAVCSGRTGHVEVYDFTFSGGAAYYESLVRFLFQFHDPTTLDRQGNDAGTQYASVIYCYDQQQFDIATRVKAELQTLLDGRKLNCYSGRTVTTDIRMSTTFYAAHKEHQDYLMANPRGYCNHRVRFEQWP